MLGFVIWFIGNSWCYVGSNPTSDTFQDGFIENETKSIVDNQKNDHTTEMSEHFNLGHAFYNASYIVRAGIKVVFGLKRVHLIRSHDSSRRNFYRVYYKAA